MTNVARQNKWRFSFPFVYIFFSFSFRATEAGEFNIVSQLLACGYRSRDAKNQDGQTAVHIAARAGRDNILAKLIESGATVNVRDSFGYTPLHVSRLRQSRFLFLSELAITQNRWNFSRRQGPIAKRLGPLATTLVLLTNIDVSLSKNTIKFSFIT